MAISDNVLKTVKNAVELGVDDVTVNGHSFYIVRKKLMDKDVGGNHIVASSVELFVNGKKAYSIDNKQKVTIWKKELSKSEQAKLIKKLAKEKSLEELAIYARENAKLFRAYKDA